MLHSNYGRGSNQVDITVLAVSTISTILLGLAWLTQTPNKLAGSLQITIFEDKFERKNDSCESIFVLLILTRSSRSFSPDLNLCFFDESSLKILKFHVLNGKIS